MRSVLSRNLHQHRLWWSDEPWEGRSSFFSLFRDAASIPPLRSHADDLAVLGAFLRRVEGWGDCLTWDEQFGITKTQKLMRRDWGRFFFFFPFFLDSFSFFPPRKNNLPYCSWYGPCTYVYSSILKSLFKLSFWQLEEDQQRNKRQFYIFISSSSRQNTLDFTIILLSEQQRRKRFFFVFFFKKN